MLGYTSLLTSLSAASFVALGTTLAALFIWFIIRKRLKRLWLPTVRILKWESSKLPKLQLITPPIVPFMLSLFLLLTALFFAFRPMQQTYRALNDDQSKTHLLIDLSPSIAAHATKEEWSKLALDTASILMAGGRLTVSSTRDETIYEGIDAQNMLTRIADDGFHRPGARLGKSVKKLLDEHGSLDRLVILSDQDAHTWNDFNWQFLRDRMDVRRVSKDLETSNNFYIAQVEDISLPSSLKQEFQVTIHRVKKDHLVGGELAIAYHGKELGKTPFQFPESQLKTTVKIAIDKPARGDHANATTSALPDALEFILDANDTMALDNHYFVAIEALYDRVTIIGNPGSEQNFDDPAHDLTIAFNSLGYRIDRQDWLTAQRSFPHNLIIAMGGDGLPYTRFCPDFQTDKKLPQSIWLVPYHQTSEWHELCMCYASITGAGTKYDQHGQMLEAAFCDEATTRESFAEILKGLGAKQIGGDLGNTDKAIALFGHGFKKTEDHLRLADQSRNVVAFTIPMRAQRGLPHGQFPILVRNLLVWHGFISEDHRQSTPWPQIDDISTVLSQAEIIAKSNIPMGDSQLENMNSEALPPLWQIGPDMELGKLKERKDREDPLPYIRGIFVVVALLLLLEALWTWRGRNKRPAIELGQTKFLILFLLAISWTQIITPNSLHAAEIKPSSVKFTRLSANSSTTTKITFKKAAEEIMSRTSLSIGSMIEPISLKDLWSTPWLWVPSEEMIWTDKKTLPDEVVLWVKRGGQLILETYKDQETLKSLTSGHFSGQGIPAEWQAIPPDHELMRSFYLIDALPHCHKKTWEGFYYDGRLAILAMPISLIDHNMDKPVKTNGCPPLERELAIRTLINITMVALATDYKKDQIHLPEILKRLR